MNIKFSHVNIISRNWRELADFYINVFDCRPVSPEKQLSGDWLDNLTGLPGSEITGMNLMLPGADDGPYLSIFEYGRNRTNPQNQINSEGLGHIAFEVEDVETRLRMVMENGGTVVGKIVDTEVSGIGALHLVYARDPEGNIVEIQKL